MDPSFVLPGLLAVAASFVLIVAAFAALGARARRTVVCPADGRPAEVRADAGTAIDSLVTNEPQQVTSCSRWPERSGCDRACKAQLAP